MAVINNFYPCLIDTYMPAFIISNTGAGTCRVYFSISDFNSLSDIKNAQITISNQYTNLSVLNLTKYPSEIMLKNIQTDNNRTTPDKYYIEIVNTDLKNNKFEIDTYYKVQIRFTNISATNIALSTPQKLDSWLTTNLDNFSEWSSVCLVMGISQPTMATAGFSINSSGQISWSNTNTNLIGTLTFANENETETLKDYQIKLFDNNNNLLTDSGILYVDNYNNPNSFIYRFKYNFEVNKSYHFIIYYTTKNLYKNSRTINFTVIQETSSAPDFILSTSIDEENSYVQLLLKRTSSIKFSGDIIVRRTSSETDFTIWEDLFKISFSNVTNVKEERKDMTIKSGVWYKYYIQKIMSNGTRSQASNPTKALMTIFNDMFLTSNQQQLRIQFDPSVSSFKENINETMIETIGSTYPFVRRNGNIRYAQFPIGGLISFLMDPDELFISEKELYGSHQKAYAKYNETNKINEYRDFIYEKAFRDAVRDYLYKDDIKLFRSATEGNYLVKLTDISFSPKAELGRMIWSFAATATEIAKDSVDNYELYNIISKRS